MTDEFGKGFDVRNLRNMRQFYQCFENRNALRTELSWSHYRLLMKVNDEQARLFYMPSEEELRRELNLDDFHKLE